MDITVFLKYLSAIFNLFYIPFCICFIIYFIRVGKKQKAELKKMETTNSQLEDLYDSLAEIRIAWHQEVEHLREIVEQEKDPK